MESIKTTLRKEQLKRQHYIQEASSGKRELGTDADNK